MYSVHGQGKCFCSVQACTLHEAKQCLHVHAFKECVVNVHLHYPCGTCTCIFMHVVHVHVHLCMWYMYM